MKVGIITFHEANNYGAVLQCYALADALSRYGAEVFLAPSPLLPKAKGVRAALREALIARAFKTFRANHLPTVKGCPADAWVFGSDQIWNIEIVGANWRHYVGADLAPSASKIAYAASFGCEEWMSHQLTPEFKHSLRLFSSIAVRESTGVEICDAKFEISARKVLDPTLLGCSYDSMVQDIHGQAASAYLFDKSDDRMSGLAIIGEKLALPVRLLNNVKPVRGVTSVPFPTVQRWLSELRACSFVVTDSYHCMIFAILFKKNFIALPANPNRVGRMTDLLNDLGLADRYYPDINSAISLGALTKNIDYGPVEFRLNALRAESLRYLQQSLGF